MPIEPGNLSLGVLAGGLIGTVAGHYLSKSRSAEERKISESNKAAAEFMCAFIDELCILEDSADEKPDFTRKTIINAFPKHFRAYIIYRATLTEPERNILTKKWDHYCEVHDELGVMLPCEKKEYRFSKYVSSTKEEEKERRSIAIRDINSLLELH